MKKFFAFVVAMAMTVVANAGLLSFTISDDNASFGVQGTNAMMGDFIVETSLPVAFDAFNAPATYPSLLGTLTGVPSAWAGAPSYLGNGKYTFLTAAPYGAYTVGTGTFDIIAGLTAAGYTFSAEAGEIAINLVASGVSVTGNGTDYVQGGTVLDTIYAVPEPMTMSLLGLGGLVAARRRRA